MVTNPYSGPAPLFNGIILRSTAFYQRPEQELMKMGEAKWMIDDIKSVIEALRALNLGTISPLTTKGDIWIFDTDNTRLPYDTDGFILQGVAGLPEWVDPSILGFMTALAVRLNGVAVGSRTAINFVDGGGVTWTVTDDAGNSEVDIAATVAVPDPATEVITASLSTTQNDYAISGVTTSANTMTLLRVTPTASFKFTGVDTTSWGNGKRLVIENVTDPLGSGARIMILERESASSTAANRFNYPSMNMPIIIMPGEKVTFEYNTTSSRLEMVNNMNPSGYFNQYSDCYVTQPFIAQTGGAGSTLAASTFLVNDTTYKSQGVLICTTGTTTTGRSYVSTAVNSLMLGYGSILTLSRSGIDTLSTGAEEYTWISGICDNTNNIVPVDSVAWQYDRTQSTDFTTITTSNSSPTRNTITGFTPTVNTLVYLGTFVNGDATNAEFFYSTDGEVWNFTANPHTTTIPSGTVRVSGFQVGITKSAGTGSRAVYVDSFGFKITGKRGA